MNWSKAKIRERVASMTNEELFDEHKCVNLDNVSPGQEEFEVKCIDEELTARLIKIGFLKQP